MREAKAKKAKAKKVDKPKKESKGLGDTVEKVTKATGIKKAVDKVFDAFGKDCGCDKRKEKLNKLFPYHRVPKLCMTKEQYQLWKATRAGIVGIRVSGKQLDVIAQMHSILWAHKYFRPCTCEPATWKQWIDDLDKIQSTYEKENVLS